ncbi:MAG: hypothetical protein B7C24_03435 [Bacteroidetes bacterium 4572_77]|nr:MAG: hypothetical protein B7C24_03435 [Bacteroidetes bacterium 4572_77]
MTDNKMDKNKLNIELSDEVAEGQYSNMAIITHSHAEFIVDFVKMMPGVPKGKVKSRIILTPEHAKRLYKALAENLKKFEAQHGPIKESGGGDPGMQFSMGGPTAMA